MVQDSGKGKLHFIAARKQRERERERERERKEGACVPYSFKGTPPVS
jgi:hypothetical protein